MKRLAVIPICALMLWMAGATTVPAQGVGDNFPPIPWLSIQRSTTFWPATNAYVVTSRARVPVTVSCDISNSRNVDFSRPNLLLTHAQDPGWQRLGNTRKSLLVGHHQFTLAVSNARFTTTVTQEIEVITAARALQLWKKSVRAAVTDRRLRRDLLRPLASAQKSNAKLHKAAVFRHLDRFIAVVFEHEFGPAEFDWVGNHYALADALYPPLVSP